MMYMRLLQKGVAFIEVIFVFAVLAALALVAIEVSHRRKSEEVFKTKDWECIRKEEREYTYPILIGKITILRRGKREECVYWKKADE